MSWDRNMQPAVWKTMDSSQNEKKFSWVNQQCVDALKVTTNWGPLASDPLLIPGSILGIVAIIHCWCHAPASVVGLSKTSRRKPSFINRINSSTHDSFCTLVWSYPVWSDFISISFFIRRWARYIAWIWLLLDEKFVCAWPNLFVTWSTFHRVNI